MSRIAALDPQATSGKTRELLGAVDKMLGATPNLFPYRRAVARRAQA